MDNIIHNLCGHDLLEKADESPRRMGGYLGVSYNVLPADPEILSDSSLRFGTILHLALRLSVEILWIV